MCAQEEDIIFFVSISAENAFQRILTSRGKIQEDIETLRQRAQLYAKLPELENCYVIPADTPIDEIAQIIWTRIEQELVQ